MTEKFLRLPQVAEATGLSHTSIYRLVREGSFPKPIKITGLRASAWPASEIEAWQRARIVARDGSEITAQPRRRRVRR